MTKVKKTKKSAKKTLDKGLYGFFSLKGFDEDVVARKLSVTIGKKCENQKAEIGLSDDSLLEVHAKISYDFQRKAFFMHAYGPVQVNHRNVKINSKGKLKHESEIILGKKVYIFLVPLTREHDYL